MDKLFWWGVIILLASVLVFGIDSISNPEWTYLRGIMLISFIIGLILMGLGLSHKD